ncbi:hypothetical protein ACFSTC_16190 [Nonomuraea ferruginea]
MNKPAAATREQLDRLDRLPIHDRVMSGSVLRFAPAFAGWAADPAGVLSVRATVRHDVGLWATGYNAWQDNPSEGGGTLVTMGGCTGWSCWWRCSARTCGWRAPRAPSGTTGRSGRRTPGSWRCGGGERRDGRGGGRRRERRGVVRRHRPPARRGRARGDRGR